MKTTRLAALGFSIGTALLLVGMLLAALPIPSVQADPGAPAAISRYVAPSGTDAGDCSNSATPCRTIQFAVDHVTHNTETVFVATGVYTQLNTRARNDIVNTGSVTQVVYLTLSLSIKGGFTTTNWSTAFPVTQPTTIDAQSQGRGVYVANGAGVTLQDLRVTRGNAAGMGGGANTAEDAGGGIYLHSSSMNIIGNTVFSNTAEAGGGVYMHSAVLCFFCINNTIISNTATISGGGVYLKDSPSVVLSSNDFRTNQSGRAGGGIFLDNSAATVQQNTFESNEGGLLGGGISLHYSDASVSGNAFLQNDSTNGGGVFLDASQASLSANGIISNTSHFGGGIYVEGNSSGATIRANLLRGNRAANVGGALAIFADNDIVNNVIVDNSTTGLGSGVYVQGSQPRLIHDTIARNTGGDGSGIHLEFFGTKTTAVLTNTIIASETVVITSTAGTTVTLFNALSTPGSVFGGAGFKTGTVFFGDPAFAPDGYHLTAASAAINHGVATGVTTDIDGDARPQGSAPDIGADEFVPITRYVATSGSDTANDCELPVAPCRTVQHAVDVANAGNNVLVASGVYTDVQARPHHDITTTGSVTQGVYITKSVNVLGGYTTTNNFAAQDPAANVTTIDPQSRGRGIYIAGNISVTLAGLRVTQGDGHNLRGAPFNVDAGNGIYAISASLTLVSNSVTANLQGLTAEGGGVYVAASPALNLRANVIDQNQASNGAGLYVVNSKGTLSDNHIEQNQTNGGGAGGLDLQFTDAQVTNNVIVANFGNLGGGILVAQGSSLFSSNIISGNSSLFDGSGLFIQSTDSTFIDNVIVNNSGPASGGAVEVVVAAPVFLHNTIANNRPGGSAISLAGSGSSIAMTNTIIASQTAAISGTAGSAARLNGVLWFGNGAIVAGAVGVTITNAYTGNPAFAADGYHLTFSSAAIDKGVATSVTTDIDGGARPVGPASDLGADEFNAVVERLYLPAILR